MTHLVFQHLLHQRSESDKGVQSAAVIGILEESLPD